MKRYSPATLAAARRMSAEGYKGTEIADILDVPAGTVYHWLNEKHNAGIVQRAQHNAELNERIADLRRRGLSFSSIQVVMDIYHDADLGPYAIRHRCKKMGVEKPVRFARVAA